MSGTDPELFQDEDDFEQQGPNPESLLILGLGEDFATALGQSQAAGALVVAAEFREQLASLVDQGAAVEVAVRRRALAFEARADKVASRPSSTTTSYRNGRKPYIARTIANNRPLKLSDEQSESFVRFLVKDARLIANPERGLSFKTCELRLNSLRDLREEQICQGMYTKYEVASPWHLTVVKSFMSSLYKAQRTELCKSALSSSLAKRMTYQNLLDALRLSLDLEPGWAIQSRLALAFGASAARRSSDLRGLIYRNMSYVDMLPSTDDNPWQGVGPDRSRCVAFSSGQSKSLPNGCVENSGAVQHVSSEACSVTALADSVVHQFSTSGRLRIESVGTQYLLRCPKSPGTAAMSATSLVTTLGKVLRQAGVKCNLSTGEFGKNTVTHNLKQLALSIDSQSGCSYETVQWIASHDRSVTKNHYLTLPFEGIMLMAGWGKNYASSLTIGRDIQIPAGAAQLIIPGLTELLAQIKASHAQQPLLPALQCMEWLAHHCWLQDAVLKLELYGDRWYKLFPRILYPITVLPGFAKFRLDLLAGDARQKWEAKGNKQWTGNPAGFLVDLCQLSNPRLYEAPVAVSTDLVVPTRGRKRKAGVVLFEFNLYSLSTVEQALSFFRAIEEAPEKGWVGDCKRERTKHAAYFCKFKHGLYAEFQRRAEELTDASALESLEDEGKTLMATKNCFNSRD